MADLDLEAQEPVPVLAQVISVLRRHLPMAATRMEVHPHREALVAQGGLADTSAGDSPHLQRMTMTGSTLTKMLAKRNASEKKKRNRKRNGSKMRSENKKRNKKKKRNERRKRN